MNLCLLRHQFRKETREHLWFIVGYGAIVTAFATLGVSGLLENATDKWGRPLLMDNEEYYLFVTLLPALFYVPFLAFADPTDSPDAFWLTKPPRATLVVGAKLLWIAVWLIGMPLIGEVVVIASLGGAGKLGYIIADYVILRAAIFLPVFALAAVANHPLKLVVAVIALPVLANVIEALLEAMGMEPRHLTRIAELALSQVWLGCLMLVGLVGALQQYHWRRTLRLGGPMMVLAVAALVFIDRQSVDLSSAPSLSPGSEFAEVKLRLESPRIQPGELGIHGVGKSTLHATAVLDNLPPTGAVGLAGMNLVLRAGDREVRFPFHSGDWQRFNDDGADKKRVFGNLIRRLKSEAGADGSLRAKVKIALPAEVNREFAAAGEPTISGVVVFDCFSYEESGRLRTPSYDGPTHPPNNTRLRSSLEHNGERLTLIWPVAPGNQRQIAIQHRHLSSSLDPDNPEPRVQSHHNVAGRFHVARESGTGRCWESYADQYEESCGAAARSALHLNRSWMTIPAGFPADEVVVFEARHQGRIAIEFNTPRQVTP